MVEMKWMTSQRAPHDKDRGRFKNAHGYCIEQGWYSGWWLSILQQWSGRKRVGVGLLRSRCMQPLSRKSVKTSQARHGRFFINAAQPVLRMRISKS